MTGGVILNLSAVYARNYHFLGQTIIFEGRESFLTRLKCVQIKNKPICAKQNISSLTLTQYGRLLVDNMSNRRLIVYL